MSGENDLFSLDHSSTDDVILSILDGTLVDDSSLDSSLWTIDDAAAAAAAAVTGNNEAGFLLANGNTGDSCMSSVSTVDFDPGINIGIEARGNVCDNPTANTPLNLDATNLNIDSLYTENDERVREAQEVKQYWCGAAKLTSLAEVAVCSQQPVAPTKAFVKWLTSTLSRSLSLVLK